MDTASQWYNRVADEIGQYEITLGQKGLKKYKLDLLLRVARRAGEFSGICSECETMKRDINTLMQEFALLIQMPNRQGLKKHNSDVSKMTEHLKKVHKLVDKGHYMALGTAIGLALGGGIGTALGAITDNQGIGTGLGMVLGVALGYFLDKKAEREGKVI